MDTTKITYHAKSGLISEIMGAVSILQGTCFPGVATDDLVARMNEGVVEIFPSKGVSAEKIDVPKGVSDFVEHDDGSISFSGYMNFCGIAVEPAYKYRLHPRHQD